MHRQPVCLFQHCCDSRGAPHRKCGENTVVQEQLRCAYRIVKTGGGCCELPWPSLRLAFGINFNCWIDVPVLEAEDRCAARTWP